MPTIHRLVDAERAHFIAVQFAKYSLVPRSKANHHEVSQVLQTEVWGKKFANPVGLAAGFDKDAEGILGLSKLGFGFIEVGSVTPKAQAGNERPRVFRLPQQKGIINRLVLCFRIFLSSLLLFPGCDSSYVFLFENLNLSHFISFIIAVIHFPRLVCHVMLYSLSVWLLMMPSHVKHANFSSFFLNA